MVRLVQPWPYRSLREKNGITWILTCACVIEWPLQAVRHSLGRLRGLLRTFSSLQASKVLTRKLRILNFPMAIVERETITQIGEGLTWVSCVVFYSGSSVQSLL